jgi:hypothetical protein
MIERNVCESKRNREVMITVQSNTLAYHPIHHDTTASCAHTIHTSTSTAVHNITAVVTKEGTLIHHKPGDVLNGKRYSDEKEFAARACSTRTANVTKKQRTSPTQCWKDRRGSALIGYLSFSPVNSFRYQGMMRKSCASIPMSFP